MLVRMQVCMHVRIEDVRADLGKCSVIEMLLKYSYSALMPAESLLDTIDFLVVNSLLVLSSPKV